MPYNYPLPDDYYNMPHGSAPMRLQYSGSSISSNASYSSASYPHYHTSSQQHAHVGPSRHESSNYSQSRHGSTSYQTSPTRVSSGSYFQSSSSPPDNEPSPDSDRGESKERQYCPHRDCTDSYGRPNVSYSRKADVSRHWKSTHEPKYFDCPRHNCDRKGSRGFTRRDHLIEHLRGYHQQDIPKRTNSQEGGRHSVCR